METGNQVADVRLSPSDEVEVELASAVNFPVTDELPRLRIGKSDVVISRFNDDGDTHRIVFKMTPKQFAETPNGAPIQVRYGDETAAYEFDFGTFDKNAAHR